MQGKWMQVAQTAGSLGHTPHTELGAGSDANARSTLHQRKPAMTAPRSRDVVCANAILALVLAFVALVAISMASYPGGSWLDLRANRHDLLRNFLCDLLAPIAINGQPNRVGSLAMMGAMTVLALGLAVTWWSIPYLFAQPRFAVAIRICGVLSTIGLFTVPFTPPTVSYRLHAAAIFAGGVPAFAAGIISLIAFARGNATRRLAWLGGITLISLMVGFSLYSNQLINQTAATIILPASHRIATVLFLSWVIAIAVRLRSQRVGARFS